MTTFSPFQKYIEKKNSLNKSMKNEFAKYLEGRLHDPQEVFGWMKKDNIHLAGGAVLKFLNGEPLGDSDLDFFDFSDYKNKKHELDLNYMVEFLSSEKYSTGFSYEKAKKKFTLDNFLKFDEGKNFRIFGNMLVPIWSVERHGEFACKLYFESQRRYEGQTCATPESYKHDSNISTITEYAYMKNECGMNHVGSISSSIMKCCGTTHIQIIHTKKYTNMKEYMNNVFDFDFCKVSFNGEKFTILYPDSVKDKKCLYKTTHENKELSAKRRKKYEKRGYKFLFRKSILESK